MTDADLLKEIGRLRAALEPFVVIAIKRAVSSDALQDDDRIPERLSVKSLRDARRAYQRSPSHD